MKIAKLDKVAWKFKKRYSTRKENLILFRGCQNIDSFNFFLATYFADTSEGYTLVTDYWDDIGIRIVCGDNKFYYQGKYPNKFKQPWYDFSDSSRIFPRSIFNFDVNKWLVEILPIDFYRINIIEFGELTNIYIRWYLQRRNIIWRIP